MYTHRVDEKTKKTKKNIYFTVSAEHGGNSISPSVVFGIAIGCASLVLCLVGVVIYAIRQKKRAEKAIGFSKPFGKLRLLLST